MLRFAFAPTGDLSLSELRIALINYILSIQKNEGFVLRVEDNDKARNIEGKDSEIRQILEKFAIPSDSILYQSEQLRRYQQLAVRLVEEGKAFLCICSHKDLEKERVQAKSNNRSYRCSGRCSSMSADEIRRVKEEQIPFTIRILKPASPVTFNDRFLGEVTVDPGEVDHFIILRTDGTPTSDFANACDDMTGGISEIVREDSLLLNTAREIHIRHSLGYKTEIKTAHLPPLFDTKDEKISGKMQKYSVKRFLQEGYLPDALINILLLPGYNAPDDLFTLPEAIQHFRLHKLASVTAQFDLEMLRQLNREHLHQMDDLTLSRIFRFADVQIGRLAKLFLELGEADTITELDEKIGRTFAHKRCMGKWSRQMRTLSTLILDAPYFDEFKAFREDLQKRSGFEEAELDTALKLLMTGTEEGPEPGKLYPFIKSYITEIARCQH